MSLFRITEFGDHWSVVLTEDSQLVKGVIAIVRTREAAESVVGQLDELASQPSVKFRVSICHPGAVQIPGVIVEASDDGKMAARLWLVGLDVEEPVVIDPDVEYAPVLPVETLHEMPGFESTRAYPQSLDELQQQLA